MRCSKFIEPRGNWAGRQLRTATTKRKKGRGPPSLPPVRSTSPSPSLSLSLRHRTLSLLIERCIEPSLWAAAAAARGLLRTRLSQFLGNCYQWSRNERYFWAGPGVHHRPGTRQSRHLPLPLLRLGFVFFQKYDMQLSPWKMTWRIIFIVELSILPEY